MILTIYATGNAIAESAMNGILATKPIPQTLITTEEWANDIANKAYMLADAMIKRSNH